MRETNASEPPFKHRNLLRRHRNRGFANVPGGAWRQPTYWPCDVRCRGGVTLIRAFVRNLRTCPTMVSEKAQAIPTARPKVAMRRPGADRPVSSDEAGVMPVERGGWVTVVGSGQPATGGHRHSTEG